MPLLLDRNNIPPVDFENEIERAKTILGTQLVSYFFHSPAVQGIAGIGTDVVGAVANGYGSAVYTVSTAAVATSAFRMTSAAFAGSFPKPFLSGNLWFVSARFRIDTAWDATTENYVGLADAGGANPLRLGLHGPSSIVNFVLQGPAGTLINSGVPIDNALHTFRAFKRSGVTYCQVDDVETNGNVDTTGDTCPVWMCKTGSLSVRTSSLQWWCGAAVAP